MSKNPHAQALGRLGGSVKSDAKTAANKQNGKLGGWPKGKKRGPRTFTLPPAADNEGRTITIRNETAADVIVTGDGSVTMPPGAIAVQDGEGLRVVTPAPQEPKP